MLAVCLRGGGVTGLRAGGRKFGVPGKETKEKGARGCVAHASFRSLTRGEIGSPRSGFDPSFPDAGHVTPCSVVIRDPKFDREPRPFPPLPQPATPQS